MPAVADRWDPSRYENQHSFVHELAGGLVELLAPKAGERILDLGCGTGILTHKISETGAEVLGIDASPAMISEAISSFPNLRFVVQDATTMRFEESFDAIFSNAALHWIKPPEEAAARIFDALKPNGRLICEFGGQGNIRTVLNAAITAGRELGLDLQAAAHINYFPTAGEYAMLLERQGFEVTLAHLFDRPTPLQGDHGLRNWMRMFRPGLIDAVPAAELDRFFLAMERIARPALYRNGIWSADYRRLRIVAHRAEDSRVADH